MSRKREEHKMMTNEQMVKYDILTELTDATENSIDLALSLCGISDETFSDILYYYTAHSDFKEFLKYVGEPVENWGLESEEED